HDANMNYVCAAGTGSFVEEVARKLGYHVSEIGASVLGVKPPVTTDRCTVFMEQDVAGLLQKGFSREEVMAGVLYSIVQNYLTKVVGSRYYSRKKIFFQGATARNKGLVAAFEKLVGAEIVVSPYCHVMGAYGIALITRKEINESGAGAASRTRFLGLNFKDCEVRIEKSRCDLCENYCEITEASVGDGKPAAWGYMCGRDGTEKLAKVHLKGYRPFRVMKRLIEGGFRAEAQDRGEFADDSELEIRSDSNGIHRTGKVLTVGIPDTLIHKFYLPFYRAFFGRLGVRIKVSKNTDKDMIREGLELSAADFCFPVKLAHAHVLDLVNDPEVSRVFLPFMINAGNSRHVTRRFFCPYIVSHASVIRSAFEAKGLDASRILSPVIDFRWDDKKLKRKFAEEMKDFGGANEILEAFDAGKKEMEDFRIRCEAEGAKILLNLEKKNETGVVILGHPYNIYDAAANLNLIEKLAGLGVTVVPLDFLPLDEAELGTDFSNL
ncbi:MAG: hypothetical protein FJ088_12575, partial [Deltaproteobacteria bacterium]|nr:hypothetical protein [Deltaproteobacteria bacterium]